MLTRLHRVVFCLLLVLSSLGGISANGTDNCQKVTGVAVKKFNNDLVPEAVKDLEYINKLCAGHFQALQAVKNDTKQSLKVPDPLFDRIKIHDGNF